MKFFLSFFLSLFYIAAWQPSQGSQERGVLIVSKTHRQALVIGNGNYRQSPLNNPVNDAHDMAAALKAAGFTTTRYENIDRRSMEEAIIQFGRRLQSGGVGLFFYAGHGMQVNGINYLIPIGTRIEKESDIPYEAVDAGRVLAEMAHAGNAMNIVILDACRDNPFKRSFRSVKGGLATMDAPTGTFIAYATAPDTVAYDGNERNGVYTKHLLQAMVIPGLPIEKVMKKVRINVMRDTENRQVPWDASSLIGDFYFVTVNHSSAAPNAPSISDTTTGVSPNLENFVYTDDGRKIWKYPPVDTPSAPPVGQTVVKSASAVATTMDEGCARAQTKILRNFFGGRPSEFLFRKAVYRMYCQVIKRMSGDRIRVEVSMEFYNQYEK